MYIFFLPKKINIFPVSRLFYVTYMYSINNKFPTARTKSKKYILQLNAD